VTLVKPTIQEVGAAVHMRAIRMAFSAFLDGPGLAGATDFTVTGDPSSLSLNITAGTAFVQMPGNRNGFVPLISDSTENRPIALAPSSGTAARTDRVYLGLKDLEFADDRNDWDIFVKANTTVGTGTPPPPDVMAVTYDLGTLTVPAKVTKGSQCVFHRTATTTAPVRDGGFNSGDVNITSGFFYEHHKTGVGTGGIMTAGTACPFVPRAIFAQPTNPIYFDPHIVGSIVMDRGSFKLGQYKCQAFDVLGTQIPAGYIIEYDALFIA
jgi:hypothetical protein